jgi:signal peptidase II
MLRRAPTAARPLGRARRARAQERPSAAGWTGMLALAFAAIAADQLTKATVVRRLRVGEAVDILPGLSFWHVRNSGIAFGVFTGRLNFVVVLTVGAVIWMLLFFARSGARHPLIPVAIGLLLGGSVSNLWDRAYNNFVTDFIYLRLLPNFNLADSFIVTGVALLIFALVRGDPRDRGDPFA